MFPPRDRPQQDSRKKDKLLCSQLQVVDFLQNFLAQEDIVQGLDPLASEDRSRESSGGWERGLGGPRTQSFRPAGQPSRTFSFGWLISGQKAVAAKEQWKELKAAYQEHVEAISRALMQALPKMEEAQGKQAQLREALDQLQAKVHPG